MERGGAQKGREENGRHEEVYLHWEKLWRGMRDAGLIDGQMSRDRGEMEQRETIG